MYFVLLISLLIAILFESTIVSLPLAFILMLVYDILNRSGKVFLSAFLVGLTLDIFTIRPLGATSIYFLLFFAVLLLYQSKYEIRTYFFVMVSSFIGSYLYLLFLTDNASFGRAGISSIIAVATYAIGKKLRRKE